ncbi:MAG: ribokinase [Planktotalea sp.]|uniref:ribokinase n=1 Tax=Planktotalea sp. TaxID=2029877 RepID=UPI003C732CD8
MTIFNLGSINADHVYRVPHLPGAGETLAARSMQTGLGGKGANMSVAAARAGSHVAHIGAVGKDGLWARDRLMEYGVDTRHIAQLDVPTGHAIINVDDAGENAITLLSGANQEISEDAIGQALSAGQTGDILVMQNETNAQSAAAKAGSKLGFRVCYAAAPFDADAVKAVLPFLDFLILNEVEAQQLEAALGRQIEDMDVADIIVTLGSKGARWINAASGTDQHFEALKVTPVDTTGAGDTFTGYVLSALDRGLSMGQAISLAMRAAALMVTRMGTADVIPDLKEVEAFSGL